MKTATMLYIDVYILNFIRINNSLICLSLSGTSILNSRQYVLRFTIFDLPYKVRKLCNAKSDSADASLFCRMKIYLAA